MFNKTVITYIKCWIYYQGHPGIYHYIETRSYAMFGPWAPTVLVLGYRSAGKSTPWSPTATQRMPPQRLQDSRTITTISVAVRVREINFYNGGISNFRLLFSQKNNDS